MLKYEIVDVFWVKIAFKPKNVSFWGPSSPSTPTGASPLDRTGGLPSPDAIF